MLCLGKRFGAPLCQFVLLIYASCQHGIPVSHVEMYKSPLSVVTVRSRPDYQLGRTMGPLSGDFLTVPSKNRRSVRTER